MFRMTRSGRFLGMLTPVEERPPVFDTNIFLMSSSDSDFDDPLLASDDWELQDHVRQAFMLDPVDIRMRRVERQID